MANSESMSLQDYKAWSETVSQRLDRIYKELCEYEQMINQETQEDPIKLMELLETVEEVHNATSLIRFHDSVLESKENDLQSQMELLEKSVELLKLETNWKCDESSME